MPGANLAQTMDYVFKTCIPHALQLVCAYIWCVRVGVCTYLLALACFMSMCTYFTLPIGHQFFLLSGGACQLAASSNSSQSFAKPKVKGNILSFGTKAFGVPFNTIPPKCRLFLVKCSYHRLAGILIMLYHEHAQILVLIIECILRMCICMLYTCVDMCICIYERVWWTSIFLLATIIFPLQ